jgi:anti-sigma regulatory factor (Ser/Thr protein kinase)
MEKNYSFKAGFGEAEILALRQGVSRQLQEAGLESRKTYALVNLLDEFCCNIMEHSSAHWAEVRVEPGQEAVKVVVRDDGGAFDPVKAIQGLGRDQPGQVTDRRLGLYMIGQLSKDLHYRRDGEVNHFEFSLKR